MTIPEDSVYKKHRECPVEFREIPRTQGTKTANSTHRFQKRLYCIKHNKWLHTLSESETRFLLDNHPYDV